MEIWITWSKMFNSHQTFHHDWLTPWSSWKILYFYLIVEATLPKSYKKLHKLKAWFCLLHLVISENKLEKYRIGSQYLQILRTKWHGTKKNLIRTPPSPLKLLHGTSDVRRRGIKPPDCVFEPLFLTCSLLSSYRCHLSAGGGSGTAAPAADAWIRRLCFQEVMPLVCLWSLDCRERQTRCAGHVRTASPRSWNSVGQSVGGVQLREES